MPSTDELSLARRIDSVCDQFEADWRAGRNPRVFDYLEELKGAECDSLRKALEAVERELIERWRVSGDTSVLQSSVQTKVSGPANSQPSAPEVPLPASIGRFHVREVLGTGAFGRVYLAHDPQLERDVAIKVPLAETLGSASECEKFLREAKAAATIQHPNICPVYEIGDSDGHPYIVSAYVPGQSLAAQLAARKEPLPDRQAAQIVRKLALAVDAAHRKGIIHRDLKPANVMFDSERKDVVIMDFGLARAPRIGAAEATQSGVILGTPAYMSPEQARGDVKAVGPASDVYSLGVILYELLTSRRPFVGNVIEVISQILHVPPEPPSKHRPGLDPRLEAICMSALEKDPAVRIATARALAKALLEVLQEPVTGSTPAQSTDTATPSHTATPFASITAAPRKLTTPMIAAVSLITVTLVVAAIMALNNRNEPRREVADRGGAYAGVAPSSTASTPDATAVDKDRSAAEWVLGLGGLVVIRVGEERRTIQAGQELPAEPFDVVEAGFGALQSHEMNDGLGRLAGLQSLEFLNLMNSSVTDEGLLQLKDLPALTGINLHATRVSDRGMAALGRFAALESIWLQFTQITDTGIAELSELTNLKELRLTEVNLTDAGILHLASLTKLEELDIQDTRVTDDGLALLAPLTHLRELELGGSVITGTGLGELHELENLDTLFLHGTATTDEGLEQVKSFKLLGWLQISGSPHVTSAGLAHLAEMPQLGLLRIRLPQLSDEGLVHLSGLQNLGELGLDSPLVTDAGLEHLKDLWRLKSLRLTFCSISGEGLRHLESLGQLEILELWGSRITDEGLTHLPPLPSLHDLTLSQTRVTDGVVPHLIDHPGLRTLRLLQCAVSDEAVNEIKAALPGCDIYR